MHKQKMLQGLDDIDLTLDHAEQIREFERGYFRRRTWLTQ